jgi:hypothetical protein
MKRNDLSPGVSDSCGCQAAHLRAQRALTRLLMRWTTPSLPINRLGTSYSRQDLPSSIRLRGSC